MSEKLLNVSSSPHIRDKISTNKLMMNVIIGLLPTSLAGVYLFGIRAAFVLMFSVCCALFFEGIWCVAAKKEMTLSDMSAAVTGLLIGLNAPVSLPLWTILLGNAFAIIIVKQLFGGIGHNFMNPAMCARGFMIICWPALMNRFTLPHMRVDTVTSATPLAGRAASISELFFGNIPGCIGEVSACAIILGGIYLIATRTIKPHIPLSFIGTVFIFTALVGENPLFHILSGGLMLGAFFMATDYVTSPVTNSGKIIMGIGCGVITVVIRIWGGYPEGITFAILLMNAATPLIEKITAPRRYGKERKNG